MIIANCIRFFDYLLNNVGDPFASPYHSNHTNQMERDVVEFFADLFRAPAQDRWGYVTSGGTEGNLYAMYVARELLSGAVVYHSEASHYSIPKNAHILGLTAVSVPAQTNGEMNYLEFEKALSANPGRAAIVIANIGTTMTEAKDCVSRIKSILNQAGVEYFIHSDAALAGTYTALLEPRHSFDFEDGADSVSISGHKFIGSPIPCGVVVVRKSHRDVVRRSSLYVGSPDVTISGSRSGHAPLILWYAINKWGKEGLKRRVQKGLHLAEYLCERLQELEWEAWRNPNALTVMLKSPPKHLIRKWQMATYDGWSHVICMPGVSKQQLDAFLDDLAVVRSCNDQLAQSLAYKLG